MDPSIHQKTIAPFYKEKVLLSLKHRHRMSNTGRKYNNWGRVTTNKQQKLYKKERKEKFIAE